MYSTKKEAVLALLSDLKWHSNSEVDKSSSWRFGASICALRDEGYKIQTQRNGTTKVRYRLTAKRPSPDYAKERASTRGEYHSPKTSTLQATITQLRKEMNSLRKRLSKYEDIDVYGDN